MKFSLWDRTIVLTPFVIPLLVSLGVLSGLIPPNPTFGRTFAIILPISLSVCIFGALWGISQVESVRASTDTTAPTRTYAPRRKIAAFLVMSLVGVLFSLFLIGTIPFKNWIGTLCFVAGIVACVLAVIQARRSKNPRDRKNVTNVIAQDQRPLKNRPIVILSQQALSGIGIILFYQLGGSQYISLWDLIGALFFISSHAFLRVINNTTGIEQLR